MSRRQNSYFKALDELAVIIDPVDDLSDADPDEYLRLLADEPDRLVALLMEGVDDET